MIKGFRDFLLRGNVIDLAVAVVIGIAFGAVVKAFTDGILGGLIGALGGTPNFGTFGPRLNGSKILIGPTLTALIYFFMVAVAVYFLVVLPKNRLEDLRKRGHEPPEAPLPEDTQLLREIRDLLRTRTEQAETYGIGAGDGADDQRAPVQRRPGYYERP